MKNEIKIYPYRWAVLAAFMFVTLLIQVQWLAHAAVARPAGVFYSGQFSVGSFVNIDFLALIYMLVYLIVSIPASYIIDTYGIRIGVGIGAVIAGIAGLAKGIFAASFLGVIIAQIGLAIAQPFVLNAITAVTVRWFPLKERGMATGFAVLAQYLGIITAMLVTPLMIGTNPEMPGYGSGFEKMLMIYGVLTFVSAIVALIVIREHPPTPPSKEEYVRHKFSDGLKHILKQKDMIITIVLFMVGLGIFNAVSSMTDSIAENMGVKDSDGLIGGIMLIGGIIGALIIPVLSDKFQKRKQFLVICMVGMVPGVFGLAFTGSLISDPDLAYTIALISAFILGFFIMSAGPIGFQYAAEVSYPAPESTSQGLLLLIGQITGMIFVAGMSMKENEYLNIFMIAFSVLSVFIALIVWWLKESPMMEGKE